MAKVYNYVAGTNPYADRGNDGYLITNIDLGYSKDPVMVGDQQCDGSKHEVYWFRPRVADHTDLDSLSAECVAQWGEQGDLQAIIDAGVCQLMTRPNYKAAAEDKDTESNKHEAAQGMATDYQIGRKSVGTPGMKKKAQAYDALQREAEDLGLSMDEILEKLRSGDLG